MVLDELIDDTGDHDGGVLLCSEGFGSCEGSEHRRVEGGGLEGIEDVLEFSIGASGRMEEIAATGSPGARMDRREAREG